MVFHKYPYLVPCYLILIFLIWFLSTSLLTLQTGLMKPLLTNVINADNLISNLELTVGKIFNWFEYNNLKVNAAKCHFFWSPYQHTSTNINGSVIKSSNSEKLLGTTIDSDFTFEEHINTLCQKASQKVGALSRISQYLSQHKKQILFKTFIMSQFNYRPLVWMSHSRGLDNKINNIHKRAIRIVYQDRIYRIHYRRTNPCLSTWKTYNIYLQKSIT